MLENYRYSRLIGNHSEILRIFLLYFLLAFISVITYVLLTVTLSFRRASLSFNSNLDLEWLLLAVSASTIVSVSEEIIFRGFVLGFLLNKRNVASALILQAFIFALLHIVGAFFGGINNGGVLALYFANMFLGGLLLGAIYVQEGSLVAPITFHFSWNFTAYFLFGFRGSQSLLVVSSLSNIWIGNFEKDVLTLVVFVFLLLLVGKKDYFGKWVWRVKHCV